MGGSLDKHLNESRRITFKFIPKSCRFLCRRVRVGHGRNGCPRQDQYEHDGPFDSQNVCILGDFNHVIIAVLVVVDIVVPLIVINVDIGVGVAVVVWMTGMIGMSGGVMTVILRS